MNDPKTPSEVDLFVGMRIRQARREIGMTQDQLACAVGLTFQQVQKYEKGINRVSAGRLHAFASVLLRPLEFFFPLQDWETPSFSGAEVELRRQDLKRQIISAMDEIVDIKHLEILHNLSKLAAEKSFQRSSIRA